MERLDAVALVVMITTVLAVLPGCSDGAGPVVGETATSTTSTSSTAAGSPPRDPTTTSPDDPAVAPYLDVSEAVEIVATDGTRLEGRLFNPDASPPAGRPQVGVVLAHMGRAADDQTAWFEVAAALAERGHLVVTYDRRGVCPGGQRGCSDGSPSLSDSWMDVLGAVAFLREEGADRVVAGGASVGAAAALRATLGEPGSPPAARVDGVIWFAGVLANQYFRLAEDEVRGSTVPLLAMSAESDGFGAAGEAERLAAWAGDRATLVVLPGSRHGTDVFAPGEDPTVAAQALAAITAFVDQVGAS